MMEEGEEFKKRGLDLPQELVPHCVHSKVLKRALEEVKENKGVGGLQGHEKDLIWPRTRWSSG